MPTGGQAQSWVKRTRGSRAKPPHLRAHLGLSLQSCGRETHSSLCANPRSHKAMGHPFPSCLLRNLRRRSGEPAAEGARPDLPPEHQLHDLSPPFPLLGHSFPLCERTELGTNSQVCAPQHLGFVGPETKLGVPHMSEGICVCHRTSTPQARAYPCRWGSTDGGKGGRQRKKRGGQGRSGEGRPLSMAAASFYALHPHASCPQGWEQLWKSAR